MRILDLGWRKDAACLRTNPEEFFPHGRPTNEIKRLCHDCPVRGKCLETALESPWVPSGVWAELSGPPLRRAWRARHPDRREAGAWTGR